MGSGLYYVEFKIHSGTNFFIGVAGKLKNCEDTSNYKNEVFGVWHDGYANYDGSYQKYPG